MMNGDELMKKLITTSYGRTFLMYLVLYTSAVVINDNYYYLLVIGFGVLLSLWFLVSIFCNLDLIEEQKKVIEEHKEYCTFIQHLEEEIKREKENKEES